MVLSNGDLSYARQREHALCPCGKLMQYLRMTLKKRQKKDCTNKYTNQKLMSIVCSICGGTGVKCTAVIDPNTRQFLEFTRNALSDGRCSQCGNVALTDPDEVKAGLDKLWTEYTARHRAAPNYTCCDIVRHGDYDGCEKAYIRIGGPSDVVEKYPVVAVCRDLEELKSLALPDPTREFTLMGIQGFEFHDVLETRPTRSGWTT